MRMAGAVLVIQRLFRMPTLAQRTPVECRFVPAGPRRVPGNTRRTRTVRSLAQIFASGQFHPSMEFRLHLYQERRIRTRIRPAVPRIVTLLTCTHRFARCSRGSGWMPW